MNSADRLRQILHDRKFLVAAARLDLTMMDASDIEVALSEWSNYPKSFATYPTRIVKTRAKWTDNSAVPVGAFGV